MLVIGLSLCSLIQEVKSDVVLECPMTDPLTSDVFIRRGECSKVVAGDGFCQNGDWAVDEAFEVFALCKSIKDSIKERFHRFIKGCSPNYLPARWIVDCHICESSHLRCW